MRMFGQYCRNETNPTITDSESFKLKVRITGRTSAAIDTKDVQIAVALKHSDTIWRTLEIILINCEINVVLP